MNFRFGKNVFAKLYLVIVEIIYQSKNGTITKIYLTTKEINLGFTRT
jgi:hypothetical protein